MKLKSRKFPKVWNSAIRGKGAGSNPGGLNHRVSQNIRQAKGRRLRPAKMKPLNFKIYVYVFTQVPEGWKSQGVYGWHGSDVSSMWGEEATINLFLGAPLPATLTPDPGLTEKDFWVSEFMMSMLAHFAATGDPSVKHLGVKWPAYKNPDQYYLDIVYRPLVMPGLSALTTKQPPR
jgi:carboxylesterase type B